MMKLFNSFLIRSRLCDPDGTLSLTSIMMMVIIYKVAVSQTLDFELVITLFLALASYNTKKVLRVKSESKSVADQDRLTQVEQAVQAVKSMLALRK
jgi:hypothetical protein